MKKTLSIVLALCLAVSMIASFALIVPGPDKSSDPITLVSIKVTDAAGYAAPYAAVDSAYAFVENQTAYVVFCLQVRSKDVDDGIDKMDLVAERTIKVTSSTLDLTYAPATLKAWYVDGATDAIGKVNLSAATTKYESDTNTFKLTGTPGALQIYQPVAELDQTHKYYYAFIAVTKPATAGEVKASLAVAKTSFALYDFGNPLKDLKGTPLPGSTILNCYSSEGLKYRIINNGGTGESFWVLNTDNKLLFAYNNTSATSVSGVKFSSIWASRRSDMIDWVKVNPDYYGKLTYTNAADVSVDITDLVASVNSFFGFSFANTDYPVKASYFEDLTVGNPIVVTDTYSYVTAVVTEGDENIEIAPTGDFSANIVIVMAASAVLAAAALAFVAKKAHE